ncbi:hypothetical protein L1987_69225 [Smallanthus sonchifolius]|uniref:Uncharacterized protein n=1 Tax=Smallanthus sonchifolius TaxID=185202 RepID=A0ACB9B631_9ASTR|nr:hypothetical protein L1987_69225 [Smallanthus sonchifolius]
MAFLTITFYSIGRKSQCIALKTSFNKFTNGKSTPILLDGVSSDEIDDNIKEVEKPKDQPKENITHNQEELIKQIKSHDKVERPKEQLKEKITHKQAEFAKEIRSKKKHKPLITQELEKKRGNHKEQHSKSKILEVPINTNIKELDWCQYVIECLNRNKKGCSLDVHFNGPLLLLVNEKKEDDEKNKELEWHKYGGDELNEDGGDELNEDEQIINKERESEDRLYEHDSMIVEYDKLKEMSQTNFIDAMIVEYDKQEKEILKDRKKEAEKVEESGQLDFSASMKVEYEKIENKILIDRQKESDKIKKSSNDDPSFDLHISQLTPYEDNTLMGTQTVENVSKVITESEFLNTKEEEKPQAALQS